MGLKTALRHTVLPKRRYLIRSILTAFILFIVFISSVLYFINLKNNQQKIQLGQRAQSFISNYLQDLTKTMASMSHLSVSTCNKTFDQLSRNAAFNVGIRVLMLARNNIVYCSSAIGSSELQLSTLFPSIDPRKTLDIQLQQGTPVVPSRPILVYWLRTPGEENAGIIAIIELNMSPYLLFTSTGNRNNRDFALLAGDKALSASSSTLTLVSKLPITNYVQFMVPDFPLKLRLYAPSLSRDNILFTLLAGLLSSLLFGALIYYSLLNRHSVEREILRSIRSKEFFVQYQPIVDTNIDQITGIEALLRWQHPIEGFISPEVFINYAESQGIIVELTQHMMMLVATDAHQLAKKLPANFKLSINISPNHMKAASFRKDVTDFLNALPKKHFLIIFEITERGMIDNEYAIREFKWLRNQGIEIAIDDFGTGHSALIYLEKYTLDYLKIDRAFIMSIEKNTLFAPVLDTVLKLTEELKLKTVAEGVETYQQAEYLRNHGVTFIQGFFYSRPLNADVAAEFIVNFNQKTCEIQA